MKHTIDQSQTCDSPNPDILAPDITRKKEDLLLRRPWSSTRDAIKSR